MKIRTIGKLAGISAFALMLATGGSPAFAQYSAAAPRSGHAETWQSNGVQSVGVFAEVDNSLNVTVTDLNFGRIAATAYPAESSTLQIGPDGLLAEGARSAGGATIQAAGDATKTQGILAITGAFASTIIYTTYNNVTDMTCSTVATPSCTGAPSLIITNIVDDASTPGSWTAPSTVVIGHGTTNPSGDLTFNVGATIQTQSTAPVTAVTAYPGGLYSGYFDVTLTY